MMCNRIKSLIILFTVLEITFSVQQENFDQNESLNQILETAERSVNYFVNPCEDFYLYSCGKWKNVMAFSGKLEQNKFALQALNIERDLLRLLEKSDDQISRDTVESKARSLFQSCMNKDLIDEHGIDTVVSHLNEILGWPIENISSINNDFDWMNLSAHLNHIGQAFLFKGFVEVDLENMKYYTTYLDTGTFLLKDKSDYKEGNYYILYYLQEFVQTTFKTINITLDDDSANKIVELENKLGMASVSTSQGIRWQHFDFLSVEMLKEEAPGINWKTFFEITLGKAIYQNDMIKVTNLDYIKNVTEILIETPTQTIVEYLVFRTLLNFLYYLDSSYITTIDKWSQTSYEIDDTQRPAVCLNRVKIFMTDVAINLYATEYLSDGNRQSAKLLAMNIRNSALELMENSSWLDADTKSKLITKVQGIVQNIGYPDNSLSRDQLNEAYRIISVDPDQPFENVLKLVVFDFQKNFPRNGSLVSEPIWLKNPLTTPPYYNPLNQGEIMVPPGYLRPPMFSANFPNWLNYGSAGTIIGHELMHSVDQFNLKYDAFGVKEEYSEEFLTEYDNRLKCFQERFEGFQMDSGSRTLDENLADSMGVKIAFAAFRGSTQHNVDYGGVNNIFNMTDSQLFFLAYAQTWCDETSNYFVEMTAQTDLHATKPHRVFGTLSNSKEFASEFNCPVESNMNPEKKCDLF